MKTKTTFIRSALAAVLLLTATTQSYATFSYTISFTAVGGVTTSVGSVEVKNLTKGTTATVPSGNTLTLTDQTTAVDELNVARGWRVLPVHLPPHVPRAAPGARPFGPEGHPGGAHGAQHSACGGVPGDAGGGGISACFRCQIGL